MPASEARKRANNKWDKANMTMLGCKVRRDKAEEIKTRLAADGQTVGGFIRSAIDNYMSGDTPSAGGLQLPPEAIEAAKAAADKQGETLPEFITRAIKDTADRDAAMRRMFGR